MGTLRGELATLLWGSFFVLLFIYLVLARGIAGWRLKKLLQQALPRVMPAHGTYPLEAQEWKIFWPAYHLPDVPWMSWSLEIIGFHSPGRHWRVEQDLVSQQEALISITCLRGCYHLVLCLKLTDSFGFILRRHRLPEPLEVNVLPNSGHSIPLSTLVAPTWSGPSSQAPAPSSTVGETRPYLPGDDIRRMNWRLWAHTAQPFVRATEWLPPPLGETLWVLDTSVPPGTPPSAGEHWLDLRAAALLSALAQTGAWSLYIPSLSVHLRGEGINISSAQKALAAISCKTETNLPKLPRRTAVLVSGPDCPGFEGLLFAAQQKGLQLRPFLVSGPSKVTVPLAVPSARLRGDV